MIIFPNAKINIGLNILNKRPDNYHNIHSIFYPIPLFDSIEFVRSKKFDFDSNINLDTKNNTIVNLYNLIKVDYKLPNIQIYLYKNIPFGSGLGSASADASFLLKSLNEYFELNISIKKQKEIALKIGSDCPFFIENKPSFVGGIGDVIEPIDFSLSGKYIYIISPNIHTSSSYAYSQIQSFENEKFNLKDINKIEYSKWRENIKNDFELIFTKNNEFLFQISNKLKEFGFYSSMSGSGSSFYVISNYKIDISIENVRIYEIEL